MKKFALAIIFLALATNAFAEGFVLTNLQRYGGAEGMELFLRSDNGSTISEIFSVIEFSSEEFYIRIMGISTEKTKAEMFQFYRDKMPKELDAALKSSGEWKDPAVSPVRNTFKEAFRSTSLYASLADELAKRGYSITEITCEKFTISEQWGASGDVHVYCIRDLPK